MAGDQHDKTEQATPKKREDARRRGRIAKSQELVSTAVLASGIVGLGLLGPRLLGTLAAFSRGLFAESATVTITQGSLPAIFTGLAIQTGLLVLPVACVTAVAGIAASVAQSGFLFAPAALSPDWSRVDPFAGMQRVFSSRGLVEALKALLKVLVVCGVAAVCIQGELGRVSRLLWGGLPQIAGEIWSIAYGVSLKTLVLLFILSIADYGWQRWQYEKNLRMTKQELREELRQQEGDPLIKARIRSLQRDRARRRMMQEVPKADVVVTNPTHVAVALRYDPEAMSAPTVVAKGMNRLAQRIREIAEASGVPIVESPPLARSIYKSVKLGGVIPIGLYKAVAEILAIAYRTKGRIA